MKKFFASEPARKIKKQQKRLSLLRTSQNHCLSIVYKDFCALQQPSLMIVPKVPVTLS